jgi:hypothetical protein
MKKLLALVVVVALCMPSYGSVLVYKITARFNPNIEFEDASQEAATSVVTETGTGYIVLDVNVTTDVNTLKEPNNADDPNVSFIFYGKDKTYNGPSELGFYEPNTGLGFSFATVFHIKADGNGVLLKWVEGGAGSAEGIVSTGYGKCAKVDIGKGTKNKFQIPSSLKGIIYDWCDDWEEFGNGTFTLDSKYTQWANKNGESRVDTATQIITDLKAKGYEEEVD